MQHGLFSDQINCVRHSNVFEANVSVAHISQWTDTKVKRKMQQSSKCDHTHYKFTKTQKKQKELVLKRGKFCIIILYPPN